MNEKMLNAILMLGGGFIVFMIFKPKFDKAIPVATTPAAGTKSADGSSAPAPSLENADLVAGAYGDAMQAGEPASQLTELNNMLVKEYGMRCYMDKAGALVVCDVAGNVVLKK